MSKSKDVVHVQSGPNMHRQTSVISPEGKASDVQYHHRNLNPGSFGVNLTIDLGKMGGKPLSDKQIMELHHVLMRMMINTIDIESPLRNGNGDANREDRKVDPVPAKKEPLLKAHGMNGERPTLEEILLAKGFVTEEEIGHAQAYAFDRDILLGDALILLKYSSETQVAEALSEQSGISLLDLDNMEIDPEVIQSVPKNIVEEYRLVPVQRKKRSLVVAVARPIDFFELDNLRFVLNVNFETVLVTKSALDKAIERYYGQPASSSIVEIPDHIDNTQVVPEDDKSLFPPFTSTNYNDILVQASSLPVMKLVNLYLLHARKARATMIVIGNSSQEFRVEMQFDGGMRPMQPLPVHMGPAFIARLKLIAGLDVRESKMVQTKIIELAVGGTSVNLRAMFIPREIGELVVIEITYPKDGEEDSVSVGAKL